MTYHDFVAARLLLAEETVGRRHREGQAQEDALMAQGIERLRRMA